MVTFYTLDDNDNDDDGDDGDDDDDGTVPTALTIISATSYVPRHPKFTICSRNIYFKSSGIEYLSDDSKNSGSVLTARLCTLEKQWN